MFAPTISDKSIKLNKISEKIDIEWKISKKSRTYLNS